MSGLGEIQEQTITIPSGDTDSGTLLMGQYDRGSFQCPAALTGTTIAVQISNDGTTFTQVTEVASVDEANPYTFAANKTFSLPIRASWCKYVKFVSNGTEAAARDFKVFLRS